MIYRSSITYLSWVALALAIALWVGVGFFMWTIAEAESARAARAADVGEESAMQSTELRVRALARETEGARAELEAIAHKDIVEILDSVEGAGRDIGIPITIGQALSASSLADSSLRAASLILEAKGTFAQIMHAAAVLEMLPIPSSVSELQLEKLSETRGSGKNKVNLWRIVVRMHFLTSADIPS